MTLVRRTSPFTFRSAFDRLFDEDAFRPIARSYGEPARLPVDINSNDEHVTIQAALAGVSPDDVEITAHQDALTIAITADEQADPTEGERSYREVRRAQGSRTLRLPKGLDIEAAAATFENGMLTLLIPRAEAAKPRRIPVAAVAEASAVTAGTTDTEAPSEGASEA